MDSWIQIENSSLYVYCVKQKEENHFRTSQSIYYISHSITDDVSYYSAPAAVNVLPYVRMQSCFFFCAPKYLLSNSTYIECTWVRCNKKYGVNWKIVPSLGIESQSNMKRLEEEIERVLNKEIRSPAGCMEYPKGENSEGSQERSDRWIIQPMFSKSEIQQSITLPWGPADLYPKWKQFTYIENSCFTNRGLEIRVNSWKICLGGKTCMMFR